jgi:hypothetical protein
VYNSPQPPTHVGPTHAAAGTATSQGVLAPFDVNTNTPAIPTATIDFARLPPDKDYTIDIKFQASDGTWTYTFSQTYTIRAGTTPTAVRDSVLGTIPVATARTSGWKATASGTTAIVLTGYSDRGLSLTVNMYKVSATAKGVDKSQQIGVVTSQGVILGQVTSATNWVVSLAPSSIDGASTIPEAASLDLNVDGTDIAVAVSAGESLTQAASDLYNAMVAAGMSGVTLSGSDISFLNDTTGHLATGVSFGFTGAPDGSAVSWPDTPITISQVWYNGQPPPPPQSPKAA